MPEPKLPALPAISAFPAARLAMAALALAFAFALTLAAGPLAAQTGSGMQVTTEIFDDQPPLSEADFPAVVELLTLLSAPDVDPASRQDAFQEVADKHKTTVRRLTYAYLKCTIGLTSLLLGGLSDADVEQIAGSPLAAPTEAELEVVRAHRDEISAALNPED
ncbi:MAG: hypothetical protein LBR80_18315 [Deltaproteobacteria bacterium]|nr:hypothetical protein [Deltaproteobacteria bacterium]